MPKATDAGNGSVKKPLQDKTCKVGTEGTGAQSDTGGALTSKRKVLHPKPGDETRNEAKEPPTHESQLHRPGPKREQLPVSRPDRREDFHRSSPYSNQPSGPRQEYRPERPVTNLEWRTAVLANRKFLDNYPTRPFVPKN